MRPFLQTALLLIFLPLHTAAADDIKTVKADGEAFLGEETTPSEAKAIALNNARRHALEGAVGIAVHGASVIYNYELVNDLVVAATKGLIVKEKVLENSCGTRDNQLFCLAKIEASIKPLSLERKG